MINDIRNKGLLRMIAHRLIPVVTGFLVGAVVLNAATASIAQVKRYEPSRPTVSPYLNLFRQNETNPFLPNYFSLVRPLEQQYRINQEQQRQLQQQNQSIGRLQSNVTSIERRQAEGVLVAPTGKGSWFGRPSTRSRFLDTSGYFSQAGGVRK
jgi:hypothetical protein